MYGYGTRTAKSKSQQPFGGVGPASGDVLEERAAGKRSAKNREYQYPRTISWQRKVFEAVLAENEVCFAEVPVRPINTDIAASIQCGELQVDIHAGADAETIQTIIRMLKSC